MHGLVFDNALPELLRALFLCQLVRQVLCGCLQRLLGRARLQVINPLSEPPPTTSVAAEQSVYGNVPMKQVRSMHHSIDL